MLSSYRWKILKITLSCTKSASTAELIFGYCSLQARGRPSSCSARWTWPSDAAKAASSSNNRNFVSHSSPSSVAIRLRTKGQPIEGAFDCNCLSSAAYSAGRASGMVANSWATFMRGPLRPPSASFKSSACRVRSKSIPKYRSPATLAARPPMRRDTWAYLRNRPPLRFESDDFENVSSPIFKLINEAFDNLQTLVPKT